MFATEWVGRESLLGVWRSSAVRVSKQLVCGRFVSTHTSFRCAPVGVEGKGGSP